MTLTLYFGNYSGSIDIDGAKTTVSGSVFARDLEAGVHTVKNNSTEKSLYYLKLTPRP
jgi:acyl-CoA thioesterase